MVMNEGLERVGPNGYDGEEHVAFGVFAQSAVEDVRLPSTLKQIGCKAFENCRELRNVQLPEGLEYIGRKCFCYSGIESIVFPSTLKTVSACAFQDCKELKSVTLNEGLE